MSRDKEPQLGRAVCRYPFRKLAKRVAPIRRFECAGFRPKKRTLPPFVTLDPAIVEPADVAHPVPVHLGVEPWRGANQLRAFGPLRLGLDPCRRVASLLAQRADRVDRLRVVPGP